MSAHVRRFWIPATALSTLGWSEGDVELVQATDFDALREDLTSANADKEAYAQNAIDLRKRAVTAEQRNAELAECAEELADLVEAQLEGEYEADSYTTQPIRAALAALNPTESGATV